MNLAAALMLGFLLGSIPFGLLLTRAAGLGDIRQVGSGNIGATNVLRTGRKDLALGTLIMDVAKGALPVLLALRWMQDPAGAAELAIPGPLAPEFAAIGAILGHMFPPWLGFRGGKAVATGLGVLLALAWPVGLAAGIIWAAGAALTKISSAGALAACALAPFVALAVAPWSVALTVLVIAVLVIQRHAGNIARLYAGTEPRIGQKIGRKN